MQADLDTFLKAYNNDQPHYGHGMKGRTPAQVFTAEYPKPAKAKKSEKTETKTSSQVLPRARGIRGRYVRRIPYLYRRALTVKLD
jgi:hypothetical protein